MTRARTKLWTVVPARGLATGKSRLASVLDATGRSALNRRLLLHTLEVVRRWSRAPQRTIVISPCKRILALARKARATALHEGARAVGLNRAVRIGVERAVEEGATHVLILPIDLPRLGVPALRALARAARGGTHLVIASDRSGSGTNALLLEARTDFGFSFGPGSFAAHQSAAKRAGLKVSIIRHADLEFDLDTADDLAAMPPSPCASGPKRVKMPSTVRFEEEQRR